MRAAGKFSFLEIDEIDRMPEPEQSAAIILIDTQRSTYWWSAMARRMCLLQLQAAFRAYRPSDPVQGSATKQIAMLAVEPRSAPRWRIANP